jgi:sarcosine oxidase
VVASPCSGHGFKYTPAIGAVLADLALGVAPAHDLTPFAPTRF